MLTLSSYLEEHAAKVRRQALGHIQVALAGAPPNSFYTTVDKFFGYAEEEEEDEGREEEEEAEEGATGKDVVYSQTGLSKAKAASPLPLHLQSVHGKTKTVMAQASGTDTDREKEGTKQHINPAITKAVIFKPGPVERSWSHTGLAKEFQPTNEGGRYGCPMCLGYEPQSNIDIFDAIISTLHWDVTFVMMHSLAVKAGRNIIPRNTEKPIGMSLCLRMLQSLVLTFRQLQLPSPWMLFWQK